MRDDLSVRMAVEKTGHAYDRFQIFNKRVDVKLTWQTLCRLPEISTSLFTHLFWQEN